MKKAMQIVVLLPIAFWPCWGAEEADRPLPEPISVHDHGREWFPMAGVKYDSVTGFTGAGCILVNIENPFASSGEDGVVMCSHNFLIFQAEAGQGGGKLQLGVGSWYLAGWGVKLSLLRTWEHPETLEPNRTYCGAEFQLNIILINGSVGFYTGIDGEDEMMVTWSTGIGF